MFWAIFNETMENNTHDRTDITGADFPYLGDHRYLMVRTMLGNIPLNDSAGGIAYMQSWRGSIANRTYRLWTLQGVDPRIEGDTEQPGEEICTDSAGPIGFYKDQTGATQILRWFNGYVACFLNGGPLAPTKPTLAADYDEIIGIIHGAIADLLQGVPNPVSDARYVKGTSNCYVWYRDSNGFITGCRERINVASFCAEVPNRPGDPIHNNRECTPLGPNQEIRQQLGLDTQVNTAYAPELGLYIPDQPIFDSQSGTWTSGQGCENWCNYVFDEGMAQHAIAGETVEVAWARHRERFQLYVPGLGVAGYAHTLWTPPIGEPLWHTYVFQTAQ